MDTLDDMARRKSDRALQTVREIYAHITASRELLAANDAGQAVIEARQAYRLARSNRSLWPLSEAWLALLDAISADQGSQKHDDYAELAEGAFYWAETMPEEIQVWLFEALTPHLRPLGLDRLVDRAEVRSAKARTWLAKGNVNVRTRIERFHMEDIAAGRAIDPRARFTERMAAFYADELWDTNGELLRDAAKLWEAAGREDRSRFLIALADEVAAPRRT